MPILRAQISTAAAPETLGLLQHHHPAPFDGRLDLSFTPFLDRTAKTDAKLLVSEVHQMLGKYEGFVTTEAGETIPIDDLTGFAEEHFAKW